MEAIAIIPARGGSKGIPNKNIMDFNGKPLIARTIEQDKKSAFIKEVYVSSDSKKVLAIAEKKKKKKIIRPSHLSADNSTSEDALLHSIDQLKKDPNLIVFLQATSPLRKKDDIDNAISKLIKDKADSLLSLTETKEFIWEQAENNFKPITYDFNKRCSHRNLKKLYYENGSIYIFKPEILRKFNNRLGGIKSVYFMESWQRADIDDNETFELSLWNFKRNFKKIE